MAGTKRNAEDATATARPAPRQPSQERKDILERMGSALMKRVLNPAHPDLLLVNRMLNAFARLFIFETQNMNLVRDRIARYITTHGNEAVFEEYRFIFQVDQSIYIEEDYVRWTMNDLRAFFILLESIWTLMTRVDPATLLSRLVSCVCLDVDFDWLIAETSRVARPRIEWWDLTRNGLEYVLIGRPSVSHPVPEYVHDRVVLFGSAIARQSIPQLMLYDPMHWCELIMRKWSVYPVYRPIVPEVRQALNFIPEYAAQLPLRSIDGQATELISLNVLREWIAFTRTPFFCEVPHLVETFINTMIQRVNVDRNTEILAYLREVISHDRSEMPGLILSYAAYSSFAISKSSPRRRSALCLGRPSCTDC